MTNLSECGCAECALAKQATSSVAQTAPRRLCFAVASGKGTAMQLGLRSFVPVIQGPRSACHQGQVGQLERLQPFTFT